MRTLKRMMMRAAKAVLRLRLRPETVTAARSRDFPQRMVRARVQEPEQAQEPQVVLNLTVSLCL